MTTLTERLAKDENGAAAIEYGLIAAFIAIAVGSIGTSLSGIFTNVNTDL